ncbi:MAG: nucleotidyltransferase [Roseburia sp.]|nr:nucleotidyltransferase [Roseburia sp.]MCM1099114.1 nucleotidyltransferase [Ruminococcus flavefaciens]
MKVNGIIAEYNPFHNGHQYQLEESRRITGADYTVVALSGNFVQRGAPALLDKHSRTEMALRGGADLVLELPAIYSVSSAEYFAQGAVSLLSSLNVITNLCFGCESGDVTLLSQIAQILAEEPPEFSELMKSYLHQGHSYPFARSSALMQYFPPLAYNNSIFSAANNILGIEYIKAILRQNSPLKPMAVKRLGPGYHNLVPDAQYCSALSIRHAIWEQENDASCVQAYIPESVRELLSARIAEKRIVRSNHFSSALYYKLLSEKECGYAKYLDVSQSLTDRIVNSLDRFVNYDDFCNLLKTKELTYARISRCLLHILLNITKEDMALCTELGHTPYARVLGFRRSASPLLSAIKKNSSIPLITKLADAEKQLDEDSVNMLKQDIQISQLYHGVVAGLTESEPLNEYTIPLVIL